MGHNRPSVSLCSIASAPFVGLFRALNFYESTRHFNTFQRTAIVPLTSCSAVERDIDVHMW